MIEIQIAFGLPWELPLEHTGRVAHQIFNLVCLFVRVGIIIKIGVRLEQGGGAVLIAWEGGGQVRLKVVVPSDLIQPLLIFWLPLGCF